MLFAGVLNLEITITVLIIHLKLLLVGIPFLTLYIFVVNHEARFISSNCVTLGKFFNVRGLTFLICKI